MVNHDLLIVGGTVVDPAHERNGRLDIAVRQGRIVAVEADLAHGGAREIVDAAGKYVFPGLVDMHVHLARHPEGHRMLARAGVTCALDMAGRPERILPALRSSGSGVSVGFLYPLIPNATVSGKDPDAVEIEQAVETALAEGALGVKVTGGHYPLTPAATRRVLEVAARKGCWCAVHAGTTEHGSNIEGLEELVALAGDLPVHIAHVNSYCRGQVTGDPLLEASRALEALTHVPRACSESYLARINGTNGAIVDGAPASLCTRTCLNSGNFPATGEGMQAAIVAGYALVNAPRNGEIGLLPPEAGLAYYREHNTEVQVSFPVNSPAAAIGLATAKRNGQFAIPALSTDGGGIPRNVTIEKGLALVRFEALSLAEFVEKACLNPARLLGLANKGHLGVGADADIAIVDPAAASAETVLAAGQVIFRDGNVVGRGGRLITTERGTDAAVAQGLIPIAVAPDWLA